MITYAELIIGAKRSQNEQKNMLKVNHIREIYPIEELNEGVMEVFADIEAKLFDKGIRIEDMDLLIAATAIHNELTLVTNNTKHFENIPGLNLENWKSKPEPNKTSLPTGGQAAPPFNQLICRRLQLRALFF